MLKLLNRDSASVAHAVAADVRARVSGYPFAAEDDPRAAERELGSFAFRWCLAVLQRMGVLCGAEEAYDLDALKARLGIAPKYDRYFDALMRRLAGAGLVTVSSRQVQATPLVTDYALTPDEEQIAELKQRFPGCVGLISLVTRCLERFEEIVTGRIDITEVVFPNANMDIFMEMFRGGVASDFFNRAVADVVHDTVVRLGAAAPNVRILEIGAGTGATTSAIVEALQPVSGSVQFCFSDISPSFLRNAKRRFAERFPWIEYRLLDIEEDPSGQGFEAHSYDVVVAANVLHDTRDIDITLQQVRRLLKPGGLLVLDEYTAVKDCLFFSGALLHGYWLFQDPGKRLADSCLLGVSQWAEALERAGFAVVGSHALPTQSLDEACSQSVMLCEAPQADAVGAQKADVVAALVEQQALALLGEERASAYSAQRPVMDMGLDSIELLELKSLMERDLGVKLSSTFLFEHETPQKMAAALSEMVSEQQLQVLSPAKPAGPYTRESEQIVSPAEADGDAIAIVGVACRFPGGAVSPESFWNLLESGRHGIVSMPAGRWQWPSFVDLGGEHKGIDRAGFLARIDEFDAPFFRTSPKEAKLMDPQQRLLLELSWEAMEDGGHRASELSGKKIGVFVGICHGDYREVLTSAVDAAEAYVGTGSAFSLLANRLSYFYDFKGPSMAIDTACSSSLVALHDGVTAIRRGDCEQALVGAVNLLCSPTNSLSYYQAGMLSPSGRCSTFDASADGYVRGEGGAMLLLKPLATALADGDAIYGLVKGTAVNHGGQAASLTAPKPEAQAAVIEAAWQEADVAPESIGYIETHGTGTKLGDPIEISGLIEAFRRLDRERGTTRPAAPHCGLGAVKTNIGHLEGAAGLAGLIKVLMAIEHRSIPATLNFERLNPHIDLAGSPFYVVAENQPWLSGRDERGRTLPRRAGVSSFGFGGANSHAAIEEYLGAAVEQAEAEDGRHLIPLSARNGERLVAQAKRLLEFLESPIDLPRLSDLAYTLQVGREAMEERVAFVVGRNEELIAALRAYVAGSGTIPNCYRGHAEPRRARAAQEIETSVAGDDLARLASLWVAGVEVAWTVAGHPRRCHLPTYPFARERYWVETIAGADVTVKAAAAVLHPLLHSNTSDFSEQRYSSIFTGEESFLTDEKALPAAAYLEMARAAIAEALPSRSASTLELHDTVCAQPFVADGKKEISIALWTNDRDEIHFEIYSRDGEREIVHCQGRGIWGREAAPAGLDLDRAGQTPVDTPAAPARKEIVLPSAPAPIERKKLAAISLASPTPAASSAAVSGRAPIALSTPLQGSAAIALSSVRLYDDGQGVFSIEITSPNGVVAQLRQALDRAQQEPSLKVLILGGLERGLERGREPYNQAVEQQLYRDLASFPYPVIAVTQGDAIGAPFLAAALCDFMVCNDDARYGYTGGDLHPTTSVAMLFGERFGDARAQDFLYVSTPATGRELRAKGWTCPILPASQVEAYAQKLASALSTKSQEALRLLKQHLTRHFAGLVDGLTRVEAASIEDASAPSVQVVTIANLPQLGSCEAAVLVIDEQAIAAGDVLEARRRLAELDIPVIAALPGNAKGNAWLIAQLCDAVVYSRTGLYSAAGIAPAAAPIFAQRLGNSAGKEIVLTGADYSAIELQKRAGPLLVAEPDEVVAMASNVAVSWAKLPRAMKSRTLPAAWEQADEPCEPLPAACPPIVLQSNVVTATAHPEGIVVVKMEDRDAKNMFSDALMEGVKEAFARIEQTAATKVVILTGYDSYFASGGTKEGLLAIQAGKAKFTDLTMIRAALDCRLPVIAAMQGHGIGAGWTLGSFADVVLLSDESRYVSPYMDYGFTPGAGATYILADAIGQDLARESLLTAQPYSGSELKERGLRTPILPRAEVVSTAMALAAQIAKAPRARLIALKEQLTAYVHQPLEETIRLELAMHDQTFVGRSDTLARIQNSFDAAIETSPAAPPQAQAESSSSSADGDVLIGVAAALRTLLANELQMRESDVEDNAQFVDLGLDSITAVTWVRKINLKYQTSIEATRVYGYPTLTQFSRYVKEEAERRGTLARRETPRPIPLAVAPAQNHQNAAPALTAQPLQSRRHAASSRFVAATAAAPAPPAIAIIGMAGQFPQANDLEELWQNLAAGKNCITQVPPQRWDVNAFFQPGSPAPGKTNSQWAGVLDGYDLFDPLFFNISPTEAESMDPQQRLFLQACWHSIENAGYDARSLSGSRCGVFVGCAGGDYHQLSREHELSAQGFTGRETSILAARISYFLNLQGPALSIDTACSSSLVALAQACDSLTAGGSDLALAGGVYVMTGPQMHIKTAQAGMLSPEGKCFTFDERADGFVPGEGVGVVVLKRLADAQRDRDVVYGVIQGWGVNQDGKTNGITAPNPESQTRLEQEVYDRFAIDPAGIQLIEAHGTGTKLGDPIEVQGLKDAFKKYTQKRDYCALGSVKSNVGHCLWAAGIAGVFKLVLALRHKQLPPTINFERLNEHVDLNDSPFYVNTRLQEWTLQGAKKRLAAISSFGFSGTNAHIVIGEPLPAVDAELPVTVLTQNGSVIVPLSARTATQLEQRARDLLAFLRKEPALDLIEIAYTLQAGREAMEERLGFLVSSVGDLMEKLDAYLDGKEGVDDVHQGQVKRGKESISVISQDDDIKKAIVDNWIANRKLSKLLGLWVKGLDLDWNRFYGEVKPRRIGLPVYPFAKEHYWIETPAGQQAAALRAATAALHPLLHSNTSDLSEQRYGSTFTGDEFFFADHLVRTDGREPQKVLPGVAFLEMARAAIEQASPARTDSAVLELCNTVWAQPLVVTENQQVSIALVPNENDEIEYEIFSRDGAQEIVHCQGRAIWNREAAPARLDLARMTSQMEAGDVGSGSAYAMFARMGILHGPAFQAIITIHQGSGQLLAHLRLPRTIESTAADYVLHPSLMDGALQGHIGLVIGWSTGFEQTRLPFALESLRIFAPCTAEMAAWVRYAPGSHATDNVVKLDIDLCDERGNVCVQMRGFSSRVVQLKTTGTLLAAPVWQTSSVEASGAAVTYAEHHVIVCELNVDVSRIESLVALSHCLSLQTSGDRNVAQRYQEYALACFEWTQTILWRKPAGKVLVQIVVPSEGEQALFAGLSGLLETAALENPQLIGQLIVASPEMTTEQLAQRLLHEKSGHEPLVSYAQGVRQVLRWHEVPELEPPIAFRESGVYLITGGLGRLGVLFAQEILEQASGARVVLTGRSALTAEKQALLDGLSARVSYRAVDLADLEQVEQLIAGIRQEHGQLNGILHAAGMTADNFILKKSGAEFSEVLGPKVIGTFHLDEASHDADLDFFVFFSSIAGAIGNVGQADYATANAFMDRFAAYRNRQVAAGVRHGRTRSINWPLWEAGGMAIDRASEERLQPTIGIPLRTATGMRAFHRSLASSHDQMVVVEGDLAKIRRTWLAAPVVASSELEPQHAPAIDTDDLTEKTQEYLRKQFSGLLKVPSHDIDPHAALEAYGVDSILAMTLTNQFEQTFGSLSKTLVFEYKTIAELAGYFVRSHSARLSALFAAPGTANRQPAAVEALPDTPSPARRRFSRNRGAVPVATPDADPIAIIGLSGCYPQAADVEAYWDNLREGKDCIVEVPKERWDWREFFTEDRSASGRHYSKWGGFIAADEFDPLFFNISPKEAKTIDPQERLFLQHAWMAVEDAGYTRASLQVPDAQDLPGQVGVYAGVWCNEYQLFGAESTLRGTPLGMAVSAASISNRVSYALNLHGPSMTLDTMCSSSLTAIHLACQDLRQGRTSLAIAGGVNVSIHPSKYLMLSAAQAVASDGRCRTFGDGGDGYVPAEGVGVVVLKRLSEAERDGDHVYGIIRGSALNHGGKTNGYTVPNPQAQAAAITRALIESHTDPRHVSYIEAHGTGTKLGDPIEIAALSKALQQSTRDTGFCAIGSVKSNIGHCESAAGVAGLTKVLLQMQHGELVPSLHSAQLNPHIDFDATPFVVNQSLQPWEPPVIDGRTLPRIAGISSFGAGGSNAHLIVEEYRQPAPQPIVMATVAILLSARTPEQLQQKAIALLGFIRPRRDAIDLVAVAHTLQVGREAMEERLGFVVSSADQLVEKLQAFVDGEYGIQDAYRGQTKRSQDALSLFTTDTDLQQTVDKWLATQKLSKLLDLWVKGLELDWSKLYSEAKPRRISLPTYPFAKERYWIDTVAVTPAAATAVSPSASATAVLHPLLHSNTSILGEQRYRSTFTGEEPFFAADRTFPAAAYLEMARVAIEHALPAGPEAGALELCDVVWLQPIVVTEKTDVCIALVANDGDDTGFEIYTHDGDREIVHCHGTAMSTHGTPPARIDLEQAERQVARGSNERLAHLRLPETVEQTSADYVLHPALIGSALLECAALIGGSPRFPAALESLRIVSPCRSNMVAWVRSAPEAAGLDLDLCDEHGNVCVQMRGLGWEQPSLDFVAPLVVQPTVQPIPARREIAFATASLPTERKKPTAISLAAPAVSLSSAPVSARSPIALSNGVSLQETAAPAVRLYDDGNGVFSIDILSTEMIRPLRQALETAQHEASIKVLVLRGLERGLERGGREQVNEAVEQQLYRAIVSFPYPIVAVLPCDTIGAAYLAAALCDLMVCNEDASYGFTDARSGLYPAAPEAKLFGERFGELRAQDLLYLSSTSTGLQLRAKGWTCPVLPAAGVEAHAVALAATFTAKSQESLRILKQHLTRRLAPMAGELTPVEAAVAATDDVSDAGAKVITFGKGMTDLPGRLSEIFTEIERFGSYNAVVLAIEDAEELSISSDVVLEVQRLLVDAAIPVVAALPGDAKGHAWLLAQLCDASVYSRTGVYASGAVADDPAVAPLAAAMFTQRFGRSAGTELVLTGADHSGLDLQRRVGTLTVAEHDQVVRTAIDVAGSLAKLPRTAFAAWKKHTATAVDAKLRSVPPARPSQDETTALPPAAPVSIPLRSKVVTATAHPDGVVVVKMEDREARNMFSDAFFEGIAEVFAHIAQTPAYKVVVLTGYDSYFCCGGTKEGLLAIQDGKTKFTDFKVFQLPLDCKLPVIAAMQGHGIGAGWCLGMFSDVILLSDESRYVSPYMGYGFTPGAGATYILAETIGQDLARESLLTAQPYTGSELKERGVLLSVSPRADVLAAAMALASRTARRSRGRLIALKEQLTGWLHEPLEETYRLELAMHETTFVGRSDTLAQIQSTFVDTMEARPPRVPVAASNTSVTDALATVTATLKTLLANELQLQESDVDESVQFVDLGLDSISGVAWIRKVNEKYQTSVEATKVYSYPTLVQLSRYVKEEAEKRGTLPSQEALPPVQTPAPARISPQVSSAPALTENRRTARRSRTTPRSTIAAPATTPSPAIAVIGMAGQFPQARSLDEFWRNIAEGKDCITPIPSDRWDVNAHYQPGDVVEGKSISQWVGALEEYDLFDPLFFAISPKEAESMDPQQRVFLQACWHTIENAGYDARLLSGSKCGVFAGCAAGDYHQRSRRHQLSGHGFTGSASSILAARIAYFLNLQGPCVSIDTACSSSLVAIAQACDSLVAGSSDLALAGGVYVMSGPEMHIKTSQAGMLSPAGRCFTFDHRADGMVPGEAVGVVLLKRLDDAVKDGDIIHAVIQGWGVNQDGKTNGITAPNPESQARLEQGVYDKFGIDPASIQLIEAHGTGTKLGDPIEVEGLKTAFGKYTSNKEFCALGSVKSNVGHCLTAAGVAGFIKVVLALNHKQLPPTINFERLNEHIELSGSPFYVNTRLREWKLEGAAQRQAAVSSFGFSGTNAHVVIGEYASPAGVRRSVPLVTPNIVPLSARTKEQLRQKARDLLAFLRNETGAALADIAYTEQVGRVAMDERLGVLVSSVDELAEKLEAYVNGEPGIAGLVQSHGKRGKETLGVISHDDAAKHVANCIAENQPAKLLDLWIKGLDLDWNQLYGEARPQRICLPLYPFAKERYWIDDGDPLERPVTAILHPLLHSNTSDLSQQRYSSMFTGDECFLTDHRVRTNGHGPQKVLPGVAYLEMARAAVEHASPIPHAPGILELRDTVWLNPVIVTDSKEVSIAVTANDDGHVDFEVRSVQAGQETVHCQGRAMFSSRPAPATLDVDRLGAQMGRGTLAASDVYARFAEMGLYYGPAHQAIAALHLGDGQLLAQLRLPAVVETSSHEYVLHPSMLDSALQAAIGLFLDSDRFGGKPSVPFALEVLRIVSACPNETTAWVRWSADSDPEDTTIKVDIDLCDARGNVCVQMHGFSVRPLGAIPHSDPLTDDDAAFDSAFYEKLLADVVNCELSIEEAIELA